MLEFLTKRIIQTIVTLLFLAVATFFLMRLAPGGPFDNDKVWPPEIQANIDAKYGLNLPLTTQFTTWFRDLLHGDLRDSFHYMGTPVTEIIRDAVPPSLQLGLLALGFSFVFGVGLGVLSAWKRGSILDFSSMFIAISGITLPSYLVATLLVLLFSNYLGWLPPALWEDKKSMILPTITLGLRPLAIIARMTRTTLLEVMHADYIRTAYSKGLTESRVLFKHALKNSMIPVITMLGPIAASLITGSYVVETVFQIPGMGQYFITSVINRDYPLVMGMTLTYGLVLTASNLLVDMAYGWIDPRIRVDGTK
ncbi:MAG: ABC transporter permease [Bdellovibrionales bacterium]|nr:ABC transporter permease [Bdellovibrionales bacterium]